MKNTFGGLLCELGVAQESISETEDMKMHTPDQWAKRRRKQGNKNQEDQAPWNHGRVACL